MGVRCERVRMRAGHVEAVLQLLAGTNVRLTVICLDGRCPNIYYLTPGSVVELRS